MDTDPRVALNVWHTIHRLSYIALSWKVGAYIPISGTIKYRLLFDPAPRRSHVYEWVNETISKNAPAFQALLDVAP